MTRPLKILLIVAGVALALFAALAVSVALLVDPAHYRPYLVSAVEDATGRHFDVEGELGLDLLPCCSLSIGAAELGNPPGFPQTGFARFRHASASVRLWPLLVHRQLSIGAVTIDGLDVDLMRSTDGRGNWLLEPSNAAPAAAPPPAAGALRGLTVDAVLIRDGRIHYQDRQSGLALTATKLRLETGSLGYRAGQAAAFPVEVSLSAARDGIDAGARVTVETRLAVTDDRASLESPVVVAVASGSAIPGGEAQVRLAADNLTADLGGDVTVTVAGLTLDVTALDSVLSLTGEGNAGSRGAKVDGKFELQETSPRQIMKALSVTDYRPADDAALERLSAQGRWSLTDSRLALQDIDLRLDDSHLTGHATVEDLASGATQFEADMDRLDLDRYRPANGNSGAATAPPPATGAGNGSAPAPVPLAALAGLDVDGTLRIGSLTASGIRFDDARLRLDSDGRTASAAVGARALGGNLALTGHGPTAGAKPQLSGRVELQSISPRELLQAVGSSPDTTDPNALSRLSGVAGWTLTARSMALDGMRWQLDQSTVTGSLNVDDLATLASRFDLTVDHLDLDKYMPTGGATHPQAPAATPTALPLEFLRGLDSRGRLRAGKLTWNGVTAGNVLAEVTASDGKLRLDPVTASVYGGTYQGSITMDATGPAARVSLQQQLTGAQASQLLGDLFDTNALRGTLSLRLSGTGTGNTFDALLRHLAADLSLDLRDGTFRGVDVRYDLQRARARLAGAPPPEAPATLETPIRTLSASGHMADGRLKTNRFTVETPDLRFIGQGAINLLDLSLDYELDAQVLQSGAAAAGLADLAGATIPLTLRGPIASPKVGVDLKALVSNRLRNAVEQRMRKEGSASEGASASPSGPAAASEKTPAQNSGKPSAKDVLEQTLRDLLKSSPAPAGAAKPGAAPLPPPSDRKAAPPG